jgi:putative ABC transport system permease protein
MVAEGRSRHVVPLARRHVRGRGSVSPHREAVPLIGILRIAFKLLINDRAKFLALLVGITFASFLIVQMTSMFAGILNKSCATIINVGASMWIMDPAVTTPAASIPMPDYVLDAVRSIDGVAYAVPLYSGAGLAKMRTGAYQAVTVVGLDDASLLGRPELLEGSMEDIYAENGFIIVHDEEYGKLGSPKVGDQFEINDHTARIVGVARVAASGLFGTPTLYTTYNRAITYLPNARYTVSYVLVEPKSPAAVAHIKAEVAALGYEALTRDEFSQKVERFYEFKTGLGTNILLMTVISFIVGLSISGQTFYTFILENLDKFGALKAIGARGSELILMILFQAGFTALTGYGLGIGLCALVIGFAQWRLPDYAATITFGNLAIAFVTVVIIAGVSSYFGVRKVLRIEPFDIFRG